MGITVGDIFTQFPNFKPEDMAKLAGREDFNGRTPISLSRIAHYSGQNAKDLSVFVAKREKENYTKLLSETQRTNVSEQAGVSSAKENNSKTQINPLAAQIPMDKSIFDIKRPQKESA